MPAEIVNSAFCADYWAVFDVPGKSGTYEVTLSGGEGPAHCTCPAFKYSKGDKRNDCKHIREVWKKACLWNPQWYEGGTREMRPRCHTGNVIDSKCPKCNGPMVPVRIAV